jgi:hypothetical protein
LAGPSRERTQNRHTAELTVTPERHTRNSRKTPSCGVRDDAKCRKWKSVRFGNLRRNMGFRVDCRGACDSTQGALRSGARNGRINASQVRRQSSAKSRDQRACPSGVAQPARRRSHNRAGDKPRSRADGFHESPGDSEADDSVRAARNLALERSSKSLRVATAGEGAHARTRGNVRFDGEPRYRDDRTRNAVADAHMPNRTRWSLDRIRLR